MSSRVNIADELAARGITRREFMKFCTVMAGILALPADQAPKIAQALESARRPSVIWLEFQDCAGCTESLLRANRPTVAELVLDIISLNYHETVMAPSGHAAEKSLHDTIREGGYITVVEGSIPVKDDGVYCCIAGRSALEILKEAAANTAAIITVGACAFYGGWPATPPNPTGAKGVKDIISGVPIVNLPGCPMNADNLTATIVHYLTFKELPALDDLGRPLFAYGRRIHDNCERRGHFDAGEFVEAWGDEGHRNGWCLYKMGCKGPVAFQNCPSIRWNEGTSWPVGAGHGCIACAAPNFWEMPAYEPVPIHVLTPPTAYPEVKPVVEISPTAAGAIGAAVGVAAGVAGTVALYQLTKKKEEESHGSENSD
ncbi:MAG: hydrogenase small subunit [Anaerolineae bacterium]|nr:hydrogenase small subunit [Anaerolineae bacterium]MDW8101573.1 hydrogenase small subunit [Anaerolineae bacterium]